MNVMAVLRVGICAKTRARSEHLARNVEQVLQSTRGPATRFVRRRVTADRLRNRLTHAATPLNFPVQLSVQEFVPLMAWPIGNPLLPNLKPPAAKRLPPDPAIPKQGIIVGHANFAGQERDVAVGYDEALMHSYLIGSTGTGKTTLLDNMARQIMLAGHGLIVIESDGNLYQKVVDNVPYRRFNDVVLFNVQDAQHPIGFNVLDQGNPLAAVDQVLNLLLHKYGKDSMGIWAQEYIYHGIRTIASVPGLSLIDLVPLLNPRGDEVEWVDAITRSLADAELRRWWQGHDNRDKRAQQQRVEPVLSRIWQLSSRPELRFIVGQGKSTFQIADVLQQNKILLVNLKGVSKDAAGLIGSLLLYQIWENIKGLMDKALPTYLLMDEFSSFLDIPVDTETMLAQARKYKLGLILANQHLGQLPATMRDAIMTNARTKIAFTTNGDDGRTLAREQPLLDVQDFTGLPAYEAIATIHTAVGTSRPVTMRTFPAPKSYGNEQRVMNISRVKYSRRLSDVQYEISQRYKHDQVPNARKRPRLSGEGWGKE